MKNFFSSFRRIQWKLTFSYTAVTVGTVIVLTTLVGVLSIMTENRSSLRVFNSYYWSKTVFQNNIPYLLEDPDLLQKWIERVQQSGFTITDFHTYTIDENFEYANTLVTGAPIYVLDPDLNLLAATPLDDPSAIGKPFAIREINGYSIRMILDAALTGSKDYHAQSLIFPDNTRLVAFPLRKNDDSPVSAIVIYLLKPLGFATPTSLETYTTFFFIMVFIMLVVSLPVGTLFGWAASRGLRNRLVTLSKTAQAWSQGDFTLSPHDSSGDEIGELSRSLAKMAEQLQTHMQMRNELARVEERNRLARDLHDTVKQQTYASRMQLFAAKSLLASDPQAAAEHIEIALQLNRETQQELKLIIDELRPAALQGKGLAQAISEYALRWQEHTHIPVGYTVNGERPLPLETEQVLFRVLQEALSNVARHAQAKKVDITLQITPQAAELVVADDGKGYDPAAVPPHCLGLNSMQQRLEEAHGSLTVETAPNAGVKLTAAVALEANTSTPSAV